MPLSYREMEPGPALAAWVQCFWVLRGGGGSGPDPTQAAEGVLPDGRAELIFNFADRFLHLTGPGSVRSQPTAMLVGLITRPLLIAASGRVDLLAARFTPAGAHAAFGLPMQPLTDRYVGLAELGAGWSCLLEELGNTENDEGRVGLLARDLEARLARARGDARVTRAVELLHASHGRAGVDETASAVGLSARQLSRRFGTEVGVGPKMLARMFRFQRLLQLLTSPGRGGGAPLGQAAYAAGYYDQPHLVRDFRQFTNQTPSAYFSLDHDLADLFTEADLNARRSRPPSGRP